VNERSLFNAKFTHFQLLHGQKTLYYNEMMMMFSLYYTNKLSYIFIHVVLAHWNKSLTIDITLHSETLSWFRANHSLLLLLNAACFAEKQHIPNPIVFGLTRPWLESTISHTQSKHASHYTTGAVTLFYVYNTFLYGRPK
jgi:hypothetical protein